MKIAVSSMGGSMDSLVSERFGRSPYFIVYDTETKKFIPHLNNATSLAGGAGPQAVRQIHSYGVNVLITGNPGPNALTALENAGIKIISGINSDKKVKEVIDDFLSTINK